MNKPVMPASSLSLNLPKADRSIETYRLAASRTFPAKLEGTLNRVAFSAVHVVSDPLADADPWLSASGSATTCTAENATRFSAPSSFAGNVRDAASR